MHFMRAGATGFGIYGSGPVSGLESPAAPIRGKDCVQGNPNSIGLNEQPIAAKTVRRMQQFRGFVEE
jgi:hypothetical protein